MLPFDRTPFIKEYYFIIYNYVKYKKFGLKFKCINKVTIDTVITCNHFSIVLPFKVKCSYLPVAQHEYQV